MDDQQWWSERFEEHRTRLRAVAYRMLGSLSEADDAVQEAWLRSTRADSNRVDNLGAWLTTVAARVSLNMLRARRGRPEEPVGSYVPEPIIDPLGGVHPEHETLLADAVGIALLVVLETLSPPEWLAYVLHDMFGVPFGDIAPIVERSPEAARQLASRARRRIRSAAPPHDGAPCGQRATVEPFLSASRKRGLRRADRGAPPRGGLESRSRPGAAGGLVEVRGGRAVADRAEIVMRLGLLEKPVLVNGTPGVVYSRRGQRFSVLGFTVTAGRITAIDILADPDRLRQLDLSGLDDQQQ